MYKNITGIILSGGKSSRMGENKSFMKIYNEYIIEKITNIMKSVFQEVIIITNEPELYEFLNINSYTDIYKNIGPLAGIHSGLKYSNTDLNFIISCDIPLINSEIIVSIVEYTSNSLIKVPKADGYIQQLCGLYNKTLIPIIETIICDENIENRDSIQSKRKCKIHQLINSVDSCIIEEIEKLNGYKENIFFNMNNIEDYQKIIQEI